MLETIYSPSAYLFEIGYRDALLLLTWLGATLLLAPVRSFFQQPGSAGASIRGETVALTIRNLTIGALMVLTVYACYTGLVWSLLKSSGNGVPYFSAASALSFAAYWGGLFRLAVDVLAWGACRLLNLNPTSRNATGDRWAGWRPVMAKFLGWIVVLLGLAAVALHRSRLAVPLGPSLFACLTPWAIIGGSFWLLFECLQLAVKLHAQNPNLFIRERRDP